MKRTIVVLILALAAAAAEAQQTQVTQGAPSGATTKGWKVQGNDQPGQAPSGMPVLIGGSDGSATRTVRTDTTGNVSMANPPVTTTPSITNGDTFSVVAGTAVDSSRWRAAGLYVVYSGTTGYNGTLRLQGSNDVSNPVNWIDTGNSLTLAYTSFFASGTGSYAASSAQTAINYRWLRAVAFPSTTSPVETITMVADNNGSLAGKYFLVSAGQPAGTTALFPTNVYPNGHGYAVWYKVSGVGSAPTGLPYGYAPVEVDIATNDTATTVATNTVTVLNRVLYAVSVSTDGLTWQQRAAVFPTTTATRAGFYGVAWSGTTYCAAAQNGSGNGNSIYSTDGLNWTYVAGGTTTTVMTTGTVMAASPTLFAVPGTNAIYTSADCGTWATVTVANGSYVAITYGNGTFVAMATTAIGLVSTDGVTWTPTVTAKAANSVAWNGSIFCAVGGAGAQTSPDGTTWTPRTGPTSGTSYVVWDGTTFISSGSAGSIATSPDCITWTVQAGLPATSSTYRVAANGSIAVAVDTGGSLVKGYAVSLDHGITWTYYTPATPNAADVYNYSTQGVSPVVYLNGKFYSFAGGTYDFVVKSTGSPVIVVTNAANSGMIPARDSTGLTATGFTFAKVYPTSTVTVNVYGQ